MELLTTISHGLVHNEGRAGTGTRPSFVTD